MPIHARSGVLALAFLLSIAAPAARAGVLLFDYNTPIDGELPTVVDPAKPYLTMTVVDHAIDQVSFTIDATNLTSNLFVHRVLLNYIGNAATELSVASFTVQSGGAGFFASQTNSGVELKAGLFNVAWNFSNNPSVDQFNGGETATFILQGNGLTVDDFLLTSIDKPAPDPSAGGWYTAALIGGIPVGPRVANGSLGASTYSVVPEPGSITLLALGGLTLAGVVWRRGNQRGQC